MASKALTPDDAHFTLTNLPFGVISTKDDPSPRIATRLYSNVFILPELINHGLLTRLSEETKTALSQVKKTTPISSN